MRSGRFSNSEISDINMDGLKLKSDNYGNIYSSWANSFDIPE